MRKLVIPLVFAVLLIGLMFGALSVARGQSLPGAGGDVVLLSESQDGNVRQINGPEGSVFDANAPEQPNIGFISSPSAACVQPDVTKNVCFINWYYLSVAASPNYMITMTVRLNDFGFVGRYNGFFQNDMYVPYNMNPQGYRVECGLSNASGDPNWGKAYAYTIRARDSAGLSSANYGTVTCPPYKP